jgi:hypothetical protein
MYNPSFIGGLKRQFLYYKELGERSLEQLNDDQINWKPNDASNSICNIINHLHGNIMSRWTNFLTEDGEKEWRKRDEEFECEMSRYEITAKWKEGWNCLFEALETAQNIDSETKIMIRNQPLTITEAFLRQLAHYSHHVGQIVYIGKMLKSEEWKNLSIPKGGTDSFNKKMFGK